MHLAQYNIATLRHPADDPRSAGFTDNLDRVHAVAERSPGFVWRLVEDCRDETVNDAHGGALVTATLSVWRDGEALEAFVRKTIHSRFVGRREEWFEPHDDRYLALWWIDEDHRPTNQEGQERLAHLQRHGDTDFAFGWEFLRGQRPGQGAASIEHVQSASEARA